MKKIWKSLSLRFEVISDLFKSLWKYKLWWSFPLIFIMLFLMLILAFAGKTGVAAFIYPLF